MSKLYIMCGLAFSGKSTLSRKIAEHTGSRRIAFDELWVEKDKEQPIPQNADGWRLIRKIAQGEVSKTLKEGKSVVYDDNNVKFEHREELRKIAKEQGLADVVIYLNTPMEIIRKRESANRVTGARHEVKSENFENVAIQFEIPTLEENVIEFRPEDNIKEWINNLNRA